jgi:putative sterol carrier protein
MAVKFLSAEWAQAVEDALNGHPGYKSAMGNADLGLQFNVGEAPDGDTAYYLKASGGSTKLALGTIEDADVTIGQTYETAAAIAKGDLNTQTAFMTGKLKVAGNLAKLMMHQAAIQQWQAATSDVDVEY